MRLQTLHLGDPKKKTLTKPAAPKSIRLKEGGALKKSEARAYARKQRSF